MAFSREDFSVASANGGADVFCLAGFLRDDDLICHANSSGRNRIGGARSEHKENMVSSQPAGNGLLVAGPADAKVARWLRNLRQSRESLPIQSRWMLLTFC